MTTPTTGKYRRAKVAVSGNPETSTGYPKAPPKLPPEPEEKPKMLAAPKVEVPQDRPGPIAKFVAEGYRDIGKALSIADPVCGGAFVLAADNAGMAWQRAYKTSPLVKRIIDRAMESSAIAAIFFANLPIGLAIAAHHNPKFQKYAQDSALGKLFAMDFEDMAKKDESAA